MSLTNVYIDGYNLYHGMLEEFGRKYLWLDLRRFSLSLLNRPGQKLGVVKYFTSAARRAKVHNVSSSTGRHSKLFRRFS